MKSQLEVAMVKNILLLLITILSLSNGCAGRQPKPVQIVQIGDEEKSCKEIDSELKKISMEISRRYPEIKSTEDYNLGVGLVGSLFPPIIPFTIFSDIKKADAVELNSLQRRYNHLVKIERPIGCGYEHSFMPVREVDTIFP